MNKHQYKSLYNADAMMMACAKPLKKNASWLPHIRTAST